MAFVGGLVGLIAGYIAGHAILSVVLGGGRHLRIRENPSLKIWIGLFNIATAALGAWLGYAMLAG